MNPVARFCYLEERGTRYEPYALIEGVIVDVRRMPLTKQLRAKSPDLLSETQGHYQPRSIRSTRTKGNVERIRMASTTAYHNCHPRIDPWPQTRIVATVWIWPAETPSASTHHHSVKGPYAIARRQVHTSFGTS